MIFFRYNPSIFEFFRTGFEGAFAWLRLYYGTTCMHKAFILILLLLSGFTVYQVMSRAVPEPDGVAPPPGVTVPSSGSVFPDVASGNYSKTFTHDGIEREYLVHVPLGYDADVATPLVLNLHGGGGLIESAQKGSRMEESSDESGYIVVFPQSHTSVDGGRRWNNGVNTREQDKQGTADDIGFLGRVLDEVEAGYNVDSNRIFATGISNGGSMTYRIACAMADRIAAVAVVSGYLIGDDCHPARPISLLHFHGLADPLVTFDAGPTPPGAPVPKKMKNPGGIYMPVPETIDYFADLNSCSTNAKATFQKGAALCTTHSSCAQDSEVTLCTISDGGHTWPGGAHPVDGSGYKAIVGKLSTDISANDVMWEFFKRHPLQ